MGRRPGPSAEGPIGDPVPQSADDRPPTRGVPSRSSSPFRSSSWRAAPPARARRRPRLRRRHRARPRAPPPAPLRVRRPAPGRRRARTRMPSTTRSSSRSSRSAVCSRRRRSRGRPSTRTELREMLTQQFDEDSPAGVHGRQRTPVQGARADPAGRRPPDSCRSTCSAPGVAGFYDNEKKEMFVVSRSGTIGGPRRSPTPTSTRTRCRTSITRSSPTSRTSRTRATGCWRARRSTRATPRSS